MWHGKSTSIAGKALGLVGATPDLGHIYFVSEEGLDGALAGKTNLYLDREGTISFLARLAAADGLVQTGSAASSPVHAQPPRHSAQLSADGETLAFSSVGQPTGFDNTDAQSGEADSEVYLYDAATDNLSCVSCLESGARPSGRNVAGDSGTAAIAFWAAAQLPHPQSALNAPRYLAADGSRLFFESFEPLVARDTNSRQDVYEFQPAPDQANCEAIGAEAFLAQAGGCLSLISSGQAGTDAQFVDASPDGTDAYFATGASLVPRDPGLIDIYDARVVGGFPEPPPSPPGCEGQACRGAAGGAPADPTPASALYEGLGNFSEADRKPRKPKRCLKGRHKSKRGGHVVCVKSKGKHRPTHERGAGR